MRKKKYIRTIISIMSIIGFIGCSIALLYPFISDRWNRYRDKQLLTNYKEAVGDIDKTDYDDIIRDIQKYNSDLRKRSHQIVTNAEYLPDESYESLMNLTNNGMMGYLEIPKIDITEPIYHYCNDESLRKGVGHMHGSSLPIGDTGAHVILSGHRGVPSQKFFSDLDRMDVGDKFYIHVMNELLVYRVYSVRTVYPAEVDNLVIEEDRDLVTLVTCTPYGINTMRLLVMGERVPESEITDRDSDGNIIIEDHEVIIDPAIWIFVGFIVFIFVLLFFSIIGKIIKKRK